MTKRMSNPFPLSPYPIDKPFNPPEVYDEWEDED